MSNLVVAMTGASGAVYATRLIEVLVAAGQTVHLTMSPAAVEVFQRELDVSISLDNFEIQKLLPTVKTNWAESQSDQQNQIVHAAKALPFEGQPRTGGVIYHHYRDFSAGIASGSFLTGGMVICPCSMGTLAAVASGQSQNLIHRAADVHLKERRKLIVVPRETPLSVIALDNMKRLVEAGAVVLPAMPGFYHNPKSLSDLVDFIVARICDQLAVPHKLMERWGDQR